MLCVCKRVDMIAWSNMPCSICQFGVAFWQALSCNLLASWKCAKTHVQVYKNIFAGGSTKNCWNASVNMTIYGVKTSFAWFDYVFWWWWPLFRWWREGSKCDDRERWKNARRRKLYTTSLLCKANCNYVRV